MHVLRSPQALGPWTGSPGGGSSPWAGTRPRGQPPLPAVGFPVEQVPRGQGTVWMSRAGPAHCPGSLGPGRGVWQGSWYRPSVLGVESGALGPRSFLASLAWPRRGPLALASPIPEVCEPRDLIRESLRHPSQLRLEMPVTIPQPCVSRRWFLCPCAVGRTGGLRTRELPESDPSQTAAGPLSPSAEAPCLRSWAWWAQSRQR